MSQAERLYRLKSRLDSGRCISRISLLDEFGVSMATLKRDIAHLRHGMNAPIVWVAEQSGWRLDPQAQQPGTQYELPGLWLTAEEIHALLTMQHLLADLDVAGMLAPHIEPLMQRLSQLLGTQAIAGVELARRIKVMTVGARQLHLPHFQAVGSALLRRKRVLVHYHSRGSNLTTQREVSPQRLVHYRDNWYLDAWCHLRKALRSFSVDAIEQAQALDKPAIEVSDGKLDKALGSGYGIFAGSKVKWAKLRFSAERARWVAAETWHPRQRGRFDEQGRWLLELPYADPRELVMDILRHVPEVDVLGPVGLKGEVNEKLREAMARVTW